MGTSEDSTFVTFPDKRQLTPVSLIDSDYDRLLLSLQTPLPNDQDFAISVCTLLSNECKNVLKFAKAPNLLNLILGHAGIYNDCSLRCLYEETYNGRGLLNHKHFWNASVSSPEIRNLLCESFFHRNRLILKQQNENAPKIFQSRKRKRMSIGNNFCVEDEPKINKLAEACCSLCPCQANLSSNCTNNISYPHFKTLPLIPETQISQRILQIAFLLRNLSFEEDNARVMASNESMMRFLLLGVNCSWGEIPQLSYDLMGNIAKYITLQEPVLSPLSSMIIDLVTNGLFCNDRFKIVRSLEILRELSKNDNNGNIITQCFEKRIYSRLVELLSVSDVMLLIYALECILAVTQVTQTVCNELVNVMGFVSTLMSLLTVDARSYIPGGCISMRVGEVLTKDAMSRSTKQETISASQPSPMAAENPVSSPARTFATSASGSEMLHITEHLDFPVLSDNSTDSSLLPLPSTPVAVPVPATSPDPNVFLGLGVNGSFKPQVSSSPGLPLQCLPKNSANHVHSKNSNHCKPKRRHHAAGFTKEEITHLHLSPEQLDIKIPYLCEWAGCGMRFAMPEPVYMHAMRAHCSESVKGAMECQWGSCDPLPRSRCSLMVHLKDLHCSVSVLNKALYCRQKKLAPPKPPQQAAPQDHPGYKRYLSFSVMRKRAIQNMNFKELLDEKEGPVTKSIRLTAALILRNVVNFSDKGRKMCRSYESRFSTIAMSNVESARTVAQILYDLN